MDRSERRELRRRLKCRHFEGALRQCAAGIMPGTPIPCYGTDISLAWGNETNKTPVDQCPQYCPRTEADLAAEDERRARMLRLMSEGKSACCEAPLDTSRVITSGCHKGHGPRFCSKCGALSFMV